MNSSPESTQATTAVSGTPDQPPGPVVPEGPGARLARLRDERGLSITEVASRLKFGVRQIEALEADDYAKLPGNTIVRGMIRSYARLLEVDAQPLLLAQEGRTLTTPPAVDAAPLSVPFPDGRTPATRIYLLLCAVILLFVGAVVYEWEFGLPTVFTSEPSTPSATMVAAVPVEAPAQTVASEPPSSDTGAAEGTTSVTEKDPAQPASSAVLLPPAPAASVLPPVPSIAPVASAPAPVVPVVSPPTQATPISPPVLESARPEMATGDRIVLEFEQPAWVEIRDRTGRTLLSQLNPAGTSRLVEGQPPYAVVIGNASHVRMYHKGAPFDLRPHIKVDVARLNLN